MSIIQRIQALLFVAGEEGISLTELADTLHCELNVIQEAMNEIILYHQQDEWSPLLVVNYYNHYLFVTKPEFEKDLSTFAKLPHSQTLSQAAIETLAIVAYRQPITRLAVDEIRGVSSQNMLQRLVGRDLIKEVGRIEAPGRPILYGTTTYFMNYFGLKTLEDLPEIEELALNTELISESLFYGKEWIIDQEEEK